MVDGGRVIVLFGVLRKGCRAGLYTGCTVSEAARVLERPGANSRSGTEVVGGVAAGMA